MDADDAGAALALIVNLAADVRGQLAGHVLGAADHGRAAGRVDVEVLVDLGGRAAVGGTGGRSGYAAGPADYSREDSRPPAVYVAPHSESVPV